MNLNGDEKTIRQLFREMSRDEQGRAPQFAEILSAANSGMTGSQDRARSLRFAMAAAIVFAVLMIAIASVVSSSRSQRGAVPDQQASAADAEASVAIEPYIRNEEAPGPAPRRAVLKSNRHRRTADKTAIAMKSLFAWRSPTSSLLKTSGDELLRSLPRLGESLQTIKRYSLDQFN
jgi:hypothetical protein